MTPHSSFNQDFISFLLTWALSAAEIYTSEKSGSDETGQGTSEAPFKTVLRAMHHAGKEPFPTIFVDAKEEDKVRRMYQ